MSEEPDRLEADTPEALLDWIAAGRPEPRPAEVERWIEGRADGEEEIRRLARLWSLTATADVDAAVADLRGRLPSSGSRARRPVSRALFQAAAAIALLVTGALAGSLLLDRGSTSVTQIDVPPGSRSDIALPGGIAVQLNAGSTLSFAGDDDVLDVTLDGDGYFRVPHDPSRVFTVRTSAGVIRDIGTEFGVRARGDDVSVVVTEGVVALEAEGGSVEVTAGHSASALRGQAPTAPVAVESDIALAWIEGRSVFIDESLARIAEELSRRYGSSVQIAVPIRNRRVTASVGATTDLEGALRLVTLAAGVRYVRSGDGWLITS